MAGPDKALRKSGSDYIYGIDLVRFACAVSVATFHLTWMTPGIAWSLPFGWVGVEVFFVISGLVIANSAQGAAPQQFLTGRFLRIYPAAWCAAAVNYVLFLWEFPGKGNGLIQLYYSAILLPGPFLATAYWTLPIELAFYFLVYSVIFFRAFKHIQGFAIGMILWAAPYLVALALNSAGLVHWTWLDFDYGWKNLSLLRHGPYFGLGILAWLFKEKRLGKIGVAAAGLAMTLAICEIYARAVELVPKFGYSGMIRVSPWTHLALWSCVAFFVALAAILLSLNFNHRFPANPAFRRIVRLLGLSTYPFYLLHERVGAAAIHQLSGLGFAPLPCVSGALIGTGILAMLIAKYLEPGLRRLLGYLGGAVRSETKEPVFETL